MRLFTTVAGLRCYLEMHRSGRHLEEALLFEASPIGAAPEVGLVPTMGALHAGHLSLIQRARRENKIVVVSIFVNPLQFGPSEDLQRYPRTLERDKAICEEAGVDVVFAPTVEEMRVGGEKAEGRGQRAEEREPGVRSQEPEAEKAEGRGQGAEDGGDRGEDPFPTPHFPLPTPHFRTQNLKLKTQNSTTTQVVPPDAMTSVLCGRSRIGHFQGVATIVTKLLNLVQPDRAYFGQKDAQQLAIIQQMVADLNLPVEIVPCPTVREPNGLALSSRNQYLTDEQRQQAAVLYRGLHQAELAFRAGEQISTKLIELVKAELTTMAEIVPEYIELVHPTTLVPLTKVEDTGLLAIAARLGSTRLIDNILLSKRKPTIAIDGPAGAGKSTVARQVAQQLNLLYLDTGAMYRALTWLVLQSGIAIDDEPAVAELVSQSEIVFRSQESGVRSQKPELTELETQNASPTPHTPHPTPRILINGQDVTDAIRSLEVTSQVSAIAAQPFVRKELVKQQQRYGKGGGIVAEGRDIGTFVFPDAELKIFLTASVQERARRRQQDLKNQGRGDISLDELEQAIYERDRKDSTRALAPLRKAADAIEIQSDHLTISEVVQQIVQLYSDRW
nr:bifunctional pantoate--beta-alanine ligase/(d)CMP kinase [Kovacikia minuta]